MKNLALTLLLSSSIIATPVIAGPSNKSDKVITGIIVGATAAALITALTNADEVKVYSKPPAHHKTPKPYYKHKAAPHYYNQPPRHWKREGWHRKHWHADQWYDRGRFERRRYWQH